MVITFCGHADFIGGSKIEKEIISLITGQAAENNMVYCYSGGYGSFDLFAANCVSKAKSIAKNIKNCLVVPYIISSQSQKFQAYSNMFDEIIYPPLENVPPKYAIIKRNEWMVNNSDLLIAYVKHNFGGAARMLKYAKNKAIKIIILD